MIINSQQTAAAAHCGPPRTAVSIPNVRRPIPVPRGPMMSRSPTSRSPHNVETPFRLPRFRSDSEMDEEADPDPNRVWSRHGYDYYNSQRANADLTCANMIVTPKVGRSHRATTVTSSLSKIHGAMISPVVEPSSRLYAGNVMDLAFCRTPCKSERGLFPPMMTQAQSPHPPRTTSPTKSIHWTLSPFKNLNFDRKGSSRAQGPFSRGFTVTCSAPNNWLKMKLGTRARTTLA